MNPNKITNTRRVERVLKLIVFLQEKRKLKEIQSELQVARKTVHRYINLLIQLGFEIERTHGKRNEYRITNTAKYFNL